MLIKYLDKKLMTHIKIYIYIKLIIEEKIPINNIYQIKLIKFRNLLFLFYLFKLLRFSFIKFRIYYLICIFEA